MSALQQALLSYGAAGGGLDAFVTSLLHFDANDGEAGYSGAVGTQIWGSYGDLAATGISSTQSKFGGTSVKTSGTDSCGVFTKQDTAFDFGTGDFCVELWAYATTLTNSHGNPGFLFSNYNGAYGFVMQIQATGAIQFLASVSGAGYAVNLTSAGVLVTTGGWHHYAFTRTADVWRGFFDGTQFATATVAGTLALPGTNDVAIGGGPLGVNSTSSWPGYLDEFRVTKGAARYSANFTPDVAAALPAGGRVGADPYFGLVKLLLAFDGANGATTTVDSSAGVRAVTLVGGAGVSELSTTSPKFGTASLDANINSITHGYNSINSTELNLSGDFTIECHCKWNVVNATNYDPVFIAKRAPGQIGFQFSYFNGTLYFDMTTNGSTGVGVTSAWTPSTATWYHLAVTRSGSNVRFFVDGTQAGATGTLSGTIWQSTAALNGVSDAANLCKFDGHMDNVRITKGYARYTSNFTAPAAAYPTY